MLARAALHYDEEPCISGANGSGTIFFSGCSLRCVYCQNESISHGCHGAVRDESWLLGACENLIAQGAHNINFVNPTHYAHSIEKVLSHNLSVPVVWNTGGYERVEALRRLSGGVQIYLPDLKYADDALARRYSAAPEYFAIATRAILEMARQVGSVQLDHNGVARRGLLIRHLILPGHTDDSKRVLDWIAANVPDAWVSLMAQYLPCGPALEMENLDRRLTQDEYDSVVEHLFKLGLENGYVQELSSADEIYIPPFDLTGL